MSELNCAVTKTFYCHVCGEPAFTTELNTNHHGTIDDVDYNSDLDHVPFELPPPMVPEPSELRQSAAERAFEEYNFDGVTVEEADGWESEVPGSEWRRVVYLLDDDGQRERAYFVVRFRNNESAEVAEAYAITSKGVPFGSQPAA